DKADPASHGQRNVCQHQVHIQFRYLLERLLRGPGDSDNLKLPSFLQHAHQARSEDLMILYEQDPGLRHVTGPSFGSSMIACVPFPGSEWTCRVQPNRFSRCRRISKPCASAGFAIVAWLSKPLPSSRTVIFTS